MTDAVRDEIRALEEKIVKEKERLAELRRSLPPRTIADYELLGQGGRSVRLSDLFGDKSDLILIHNMGTGCTYCTLWADGLNGVLDHLQDRAAVALISPDAPNVQANFAASRGWQFPLVSASGSSINRDLGMVGSDGESAYPGVSTFRRDPDGSLHLIAQATFGPGDDFCSVWPLLDLLADGANGWEPKYRYGGLTMA